MAIYAYMAHHQGMSLVALDDVLHRGIMRQRFHADVRVRAVESLLFEGVPITRPPRAKKWKRLPARPIAASARNRPSAHGRRKIPPSPRVHLQGNGRYSLDGDELRRRL